MQRSLSDTTDLKLITSVVLLGASNLTRGISCAVETSRLLLGAPINVFAACGLGRSFGKRSRVLARDLPGITECGIWDALRNQPGPRPTFALITDLGNDILYGEKPQSIVNWVAECVDRLTGSVEADGNAETISGGGANSGGRGRIIITQLPMASILSLPRWRFEIVRRLIFPANRAPFREVVVAAIELNERLVDFAAHRGIQTVEMEGEWYGFDPIHIRPRHWPQAWNRILYEWVDDAEPVRARGSITRRIALLRARPERYWVFNRPRHQEQPAVCLRDGTIVSLY